MVSVNKLNIDKMRLFMLIFGIFNIGIGISIDNKGALNEEVLNAKRTKWGQFEDNKVNSDPTVALEGQCVVVCDADVIGSTTVTPQSSDVTQSTPRDHTTASASRQGTADKWSNGGLCINAKRPNRIAFSVKRNSNLGVPDFKQEERRTVQFDNILVNIGYGFETETSTFIAPVGGTYSFSFQIFKLYNNRALTVSLMVSLLINLMRRFKKNVNLEKLQRKFCCIFL